MVFLSQMPPRRSQRQKRPSQQALESLVSVPSRRRRHQQPAGDPGQVHEDGLPVHEDGVGSEHRGDALLFLIKLKTVMNFKLFN